MRNELFAYVNEVTCNDFSYFVGKERIFSLCSKQLLGYHWYHGMNLMEDS